MSSTTEQPQSTAPSAPPSGIMAIETLRAKDAIERALAAEGIAAPVNDLRPLPFEGVWGVASSVCMGLASDLVLRDLEASGELAGLSKRGEEESRRSIAGARDRAVGSRSSPDRNRGRFNKVEAVNGYINITFDATLSPPPPDRRGARAVRQYGQGAPSAETGDGRALPAEHPQGLPRRPPAQLRARRRRQQYPERGGLPCDAGDLPRRHRHARHQMPLVLRAISIAAKNQPSPLARGRWLGEVYAEVGRAAELPQGRARLPASRWRGTIRSSSHAIDRMLKYLWRKNTDGEDIAYLLGRVHPRSGDQGPSCCASRM